MGKTIILEEKRNHDISVKIDNKDEGCLSLSDKRVDYENNEGTPVIRLEKSGEIFVVKKSNNIIGSVYPKNGGYEYIDKKGNVFILEETMKNGFTFKKAGEGGKPLSNISIFPLAGIDYGMKPHLDTDYY